MSSSAKTGREGEKQVAAILGRLDANRFRVLNDLMIRTGYGTSQIDHVVISEGGVFVIETKNYRGTVHGTDKDLMWTQTVPPEEKRAFFNPVRQNFTHVQALRQILKPVRGTIPLLSVVVFPRDTVLDVKTHSRVMRYGDLEAAVKEERTPVISPENCIRIQQLLEKANITDPDARRRHAVSVRQKMKQKLETGS